LNFVSKNISIGLSYTPTGSVLAVLLLLGFFFVMFYELSDDSLDSDFSTSLTALRPLLSGFL